jgi:hypothetical protein
VEQLEELAEALLNFTEISDLTAWIREHGLWWHVEWSDVKSATVQNGSDPFYTWTFSLEKLMFTIAEAQYENGYRIKLKFKKFYLAEWPALVFPCSFDL